MPYRKIPQNLCLNEQIKRPWIFQFAFEVDLHEFQGKIKPERYYASRFHCNRAVIRRLLQARNEELEDATNMRPKGDQEATNQPNINNDLDYLSDQSATKTRPTSDQQVLRETETETDKRKKTLCPDPLPSEMTEALLNRIRLRHPGEKRSAHRGRLEAAVESLRLKREKSYDWTRRIWGYLHNVDASDAKKAGDPHPNSWRDLEKFEAGAAARSAETTAEVEKEYGNREENLKKFKNFPPMPENFGQMPR